MSEEIKQEKKPAQKMAPQIIVNSPAKKSSIDELYRDNPGKEFAYAPLGAGDGSYIAGGLSPVTGKDGKPMRVGNKVICEVVSSDFNKQTIAAHKAATKAIEQVLDPEQPNSAPKTAVKKTPPKKKKK